MEDTLKKLIAEHGLDAHEKKLLEVAQVGLRLIKQPARPLRVGTSRLGGSPDVPADFAWPERNGQPLSFLAQINCAEAAPYDLERVLPDTGLLYLFYDMEDQPWGFDPADKGGAVVLYMTDESFAPVDPPDDLDPDFVLPAIPIGFERFLSIPSPFSKAFVALGLEEADDDAYWNLYDAVRGGEDGNAPGHQLLGLPNNIQDDMALECQLVTHGLYCGEPSGYQDPRARELEAGAADWRLLLQIDTDDDLNLMWGDCGMIYVWIRDPDLRARKFDGAWTILQCT